MVSFREIHKDLFEGTSMIMGQIHKLLATSANIYRKKRHYNPRNIYRWWIKENEKNIDELELKTRNILKVLEDFREDVNNLKKTPRFESYEDIIQKVNDFTEENSKVIQELMKYVEFLNSKDEITLYMLYHSDFWRSDKNDMVSKNKEEIPQDDLNYDRYCVEFAMGVREGDGVPFYEETRTEVWMEYYDSIDPEIASQIKPPDFSERIINRTGWVILNMYSLYFSNLRKSMRRILEKIDEYWNEEYPEVLLEKHIEKIKNEICQKINNDVIDSKQFNVTLDNLLSIYASHQVENIFTPRQKVAEIDFHKVVYRSLYSHLGSKIEDHKKVAHGDIDFLIFNYPLDVKVEGSEQDLEKIYNKHKDQIALYCYHRKEDLGFLLVYEKSKKNKDFSTKDYDVFKEKDYYIIVILLRANFPHPSEIKHRKK